MYRLVTHADPWGLDPWHLMSLLVCTLPFTLAWCAVSLYRWSASSRHGFRLVCRSQSGNTSLDDRAWHSLAERAEKVWNYEWQRFSESLRMAGLHGLIFGLISSLTLIVCTMILGDLLFGNKAPAATDVAIGGPSKPALIAVAIGTATAFAFANELGRILFRVALRDAGTEIFSFATKNTILVVASALLFSTLLSSGLAQLNGHNDTTTPLGVHGFIVIGATIAVVGGRAMRFVSDRATSVLGLGTARAVEATDLAQIEGLREDDIGRLAEEGVDSLHALAFIPLPRLLFNTKYGLERLCDWQDQALLLTHVGPAKARLLREHMLVRGAIAAQDVARRFFPGAPDDQGQIDGAADQPMQDKIANLLGFASYAHARFALNELVNDEVVNRLRVYATAAHTFEDPGEDCASLDRIVDHTPGPPA
jgi:hypothetical protein